MNSTGNSIRERLFNPHQEIMNTARENRFNSEKLASFVSSSRLNIHNILRNCETTTRQSTSKAGVSYQLRYFSSLEFHVERLSFCGGSPWTLMPAHSFTCRYKRCTLSVRSIPELCVFSSPLGERLIIAAYTIEKMFG